MNLLVLIKPAIQYANAVVMTLKEMAKTLASTLEVMYEIDYETEFAGFSNLTEGAEATTEALEELSKKVEQLPFDKLNILGDTGTTSSNLAIDENILGGLKEYQIYLDNINYKAKDVSKNILTWLGYTQYVDEATGEVGYKLNYAGSNLQTIITAIAGIGSMIGTFAIGQKLTTAFETIKNIGVSLGGAGTSISGIVVLVGAMIGSFVSLYNSSETFKESVNGALSSIKDSLGTIFNKFKDIYNAVKPFLDILIDFVVTYLAHTILNVINFFDHLLGAIASLLSLDIKGFFENIWGYIQDYILIIPSILDEVFGTNIVSDIQSTIFNPDWWENMWNKIVSFFKSIPTWFNNNVWKPIGNFFIGLINNIISGFENMINFFIKGINKLIGGVGEALSFVGINIGTIQEVSFGRIPALAKGGVITQPTTALVGEYAGASSNPEIVTPENLMREVFVESMLPIAQAIMSGNRDVVTAIEDMANRPIEMDGRKVSERLYSHLEGVAIRKGKTLFGT